MSIIKRTLSGDNTIPVAGNNGGGGIIMQPQPPAPVDCPDAPDCPPGGCVPDNYSAKWWYKSNHTPIIGQYTDNKLTDDDVWPGQSYQHLIGVVVDPIKSPINSDYVTALCCTEVIWTVNASQGFDYAVVNGALVIIRGDAAGGVLIATPTVCGHTLNTLEYEAAGF